MAWDLDPQKEQDFSLRFAPEVLLKAYGFSLFRVYYLGFVSTGDSLGDQQQGMMGGLIQAEKQTAHVHQEKTKSVSGETGAVHCSLNGVTVPVSTGRNRSPAKPGRFTARSTG